MKEKLVGGEKEKDQSKKVERISIIPRVGRITKHGSSG
jgi:hypothetical protein